MRICFAGTPEFAAVALEALLRAGCVVELVLTRRDRPAGRGLGLQTSPVKRIAEARGISVAQPDSLKAPSQLQPLIDCRPDLMVVAAYGLILPREVLAIPRLGCVNIHASLLPRWRGAAPVQRAILAGDACTGITVMQMDAGLDTGPILLSEAIPIDAEDTAGSLTSKLAHLGGRLIVEALAGLESGSLRAATQPCEGVTYAPKLGKGEAALDWRRPASDLQRCVRAFNPSPGASAVIGSTSIKIWSAVPSASTGGVPGEVLATGADGVVVSCGSGALRLTELQKAGGRRLGADAFLRGFPIRKGACFGIPAS
jgi:methionyl-tRNA formyltransferase